MSFGILTSDEIVNQISGSDSIFSDEYQDFESFAASLSHETSEQIRQNANQDWAQIWQFLLGLAQTHDLAGHNGQIENLKRLQGLLSQFSVKYADFLSKGDLEKLRWFERRVELSAAIHRAILLLNAKQEKAIDTFRNADEGIKVLCGNAIDFAGMQSHAARSDFLDFIKKLSVNILTTNFSDYRGCTNQEDKILSKLKKSIRRRANLLLQKLNAFIKKQGLIEFETDGRRVYLRPDSAEGKAVRRIEAIESGEKVEWVTTIRQGDPIDEEALDRWLTERGYPV